MSTSSRLRARLREFPERRRSFNCWRATRPGYRPLSTQGARLHGGRWNPPGLAVLYASLEPRTVRAEMIRNTERRGVPESAAYPLRLHRLELRARTVDLSQKGRLAAFGIEEPPSVLTPLARTRAVGLAASDSGIEALLVPSVAGPGGNLVLIAGNLADAPRVIETISLRSPRGWPG